MRGIFMAQGNESECGPYGRIHDVQNELELGGYKEQASYCIACDDETEWIIAPDQGYRDEIPIVLPSYFTSFSSVLLRARNAVISSFSRGRTLMRARS